MQPCIALPNALTEIVGVFVDDRQRRLRSAWLAEVAAAWIATELHEPLRTALLQCLDSPACSIEIVQRRDFLALPAEALQLAGSEQRRRYEQATRVVVIRANHRFEHPLLGVLFPRAVSQALVEATGGVAIEPALVRLRSLKLAPAHPNDGSVLIGHFIELIELRKLRGELALRTLGMQRFGLPDLLVRDANERSAPALRWLLHAIGQRLLFAALSCRDAGLDAVCCPEEDVVLGEIRTRFAWLGDRLLEVCPARSARGIDSVPETSFGLRRSA